MATPQPLTPTVIVRTGARMQQEETKTEEPDRSSSCVQVPEANSRPVPAPRRVFAPVPAPRTKTLQTVSSSHAAGISSQSKSSPVSTHINRPTRPTVKTDHPWLNIIHPGPWTKLPPAPAPVRPAQPRSASNPRGSWYRPRVPPLNPVSRNLNEDTREETDLSETLAGDTCPVGSSDLDNTGNPNDPQPRGAQSHNIPRSVSVPVVPPACSHNPFEASTSETSSRSEVQADPCVSAEDLQVEKGQLDKQVEALDLRRMELERNLRDCKNDKDDERMLMDWFALIHERQILVRRDAELVYLTKQQKLEEKQADVEHKLRCLLNKPESGWSQQDRGREKDLLDELVAIIEQRNQIISSLDQDRQRESEEDVVWEVMMKNKDLQKERLKELKKSKGKFNLNKAFKMLNHQAESTKDSTDKKS